MPFNYDYYSTICLHLEKNPPPSPLYEEAWIRVYISTLYYSAYNLLKSKYNFNSQYCTGSVHKGIREHLTNCKSIPINYINELKNFHELRVQCDYDNPSIKINKHNLAEAKNYFSNLSSYF